MIKIYKIELRCKLTIALTGKKSHNDFLINEVTKNKETQVDRTQLSV